jgi:tetratricopeptide (TPR) repeat protein
MAVERRFDVVLLGYRNDVARARTLDFVRQLPAAESGPVAIDVHTRLPQCLFTGLERARAQEIRLQLEALGAQVTIEDTRLPGLLPVSEVTPRPKAARWLLLLIVAGLAAGVWRWRFADRAPPAPPPLAPANASMEPLRGRAELANEPAAVTFNAEAIQFASEGRFGEAVDRLQMALRVAPDHPVLTRNVETVFLNWGVADLAADDLDAAAEHLGKAAQMGDRSDVLRALGVAYTRQGNYTLAAATLERALKLDATDQNTMLALAEVYLKLEKRAAALELLQHAREAGARGPELDRLLQQLSREVDAEWDFVQLDSRHFLVSFGDAEDRRAVRLVLDTLENVYEDVGAKLNQHPDERTTVVLYTQRDFHAVTRSPHWAGGVFDGRIKIAARGLDEDDTDLVRVLRHEYAHSLVARLTRGRCPIWLNEGIAVWAEETEDGDHDTWALRKIADQGVYPFDELTTSFEELPPDRVEGAYAQSYLAIRSLVDGYGTAKLVRLLEALGQQASFEDAFASIYPGDVAGFQRNLLRRLSG